MIITPAITALLDQHRAIIESRAWSFDEKVGYLTAHYERQHFTGDAGADAALFSLAPMIRAALIERQNERLKALAHSAPAPAPATEQPRTPRRSLVEQIATERQATQRASEQLQRARTPESYMIALENLQLHSTRLVALERKRER